jgi:cytochrome b561
MSASTQHHATSYSSGAKFFHWLTVALLLAQFAVGWIMPDIKRGMQPESLMNLHMSLGIVILAVIVLRLIWRVMVGAPAAERGLPGWQRAAASTVHGLLYLLVFVMIFTGWSFASMRGWTITVFALVQMPALFAQGSGIGHDIGELHETASWVLLSFVGLHVLAALAHQFVFRDNVMQRMLPGSLTGTPRRRAY